jgi:hypothetical protein
MLWVLVLLIYIPVLITNPYDTGYALCNAAMHLALSGCALIYAGTQRDEAIVQQTSSLHDPALMQS